MEPPPARFIGVTAARVAWNAVSAFVRHASSNCTPRTMRTA